MASDNAPVPSDISIISGNDKSYESIPSYGFVPTEYNCQTGDIKYEFKKIEKSVQSDVEIYYNTDKPDWFKGD